MKKATNRLLLGLVGAFSAFGLILGGKAIVVGDKTNPVEVAAAEGETETFMFTDAASITNNGWTSQLESGKTWNKDSNGRGISVSQSNGSLTYRLPSDYGVSKIDVVASANATGYTLTIGSASKSVAKSNNATYTFDNLSFEPGSEIVVSWTRGSNVKSIMFKSITFTKVVEEVPEDVYLAELSLAEGTGKTGYFIGDDFSSEGYEVTGTYRSKEIDPDYESVIDLSTQEGLEWSSIDTSTIGTQKLYVTYDGVKSNEIDIIVSEAPSSFRYDLKDMPGFSSWDSSYTPHNNINYEDFTLSFSSANKQSTTITDIPVSKDNTTTLISKGKTIVGIEFGFRQWTTKKQTLTLLVGEAENSVTQVASVSFPDDGTSISYRNSTGFKAVKVEAESSYQIGWEYIIVEYAKESASQTNEYAQKFLDTMTCSENSVTAEDGAWDQMSSEFDSLSDADKKIFQEAKADAASQNIVEQAVARYDRIVGKYGTSVYKDFMGRNPASISGAYAVNHNGNDGSVYAVAGIAVSAVLAAGALIILRKKQRA